MIYIFLCFLSCDNKSQYTDVVDVEEDLDVDLDGYLASEDCDDTDPYVHPSATEVCDGLDNDCDGDVDEGVLHTYYIDADGDGYGNTDEPIEACEPLEHTVAVANDCDDSNPEKYPGSVTQCEDIKTSFCASGGHISGSTHQGIFCFAPSNTVSGASASGVSFQWQPGPMTLLSE